MKRTIEAANAYVKMECPFVDHKYFPAYHAAPPVGWVNDPCGFIEAFGQYHLYGQYHPYSSQWGPMHWGHWASDDLVKWDWQGVALAPDTSADEGGCFTGTAQIAGGPFHMGRFQSGQTGDAPYQRNGADHRAPVAVFFLEGGQLHGRGRAPGPDHVGGQLALGHPACGCCGMARSRSSQKSASMISSAAICA